MQHAVSVVARSIRGAEKRTLAGQTHNVSAKALTPAAEEFLVDPEE